jgi:hypothetical protein
MKSDVMGLKHYPVSVIDVNSMEAIPMCLGTIKIG